MCKPKLSNTDPKRVNFFAAQLLHCITLCRRSWYLDHMRVFHNLAQVHFLILLQQLEQIKLMHLNNWTPDLCSVWSCSTCVLLKTKTAVFNWNASQAFKLPGAQIYERFNRMLFLFSFICRGEIDAVWTLEKWVIIQELGTITNKDLWLNSCVAFVCS